MKTKCQLIRSNFRLAQAFWGPLSRPNVNLLRALTEKYSLSIALGDIKLFDQSWYVTHAGLLRLSERKRCHGVEVRLERRVSDPLMHRWVFRAVVYKDPGSKGFVGYGDADPSNVSALVRGAEMRVAETRAVNRALRKAYGIGICSVEEMGTIPNPVEKLPPQNANGNWNGSGPKVRDRLCQIIRQHKLDPELVKAYAVDFCGTKALRDDSREQVENFVQELADWAAKDRNALLCQLNSYSHPKQEVVA